MDEIILTFDVDWAPEFAIDFVADRLASAGVRSTWLVTDQNSAIARLRSMPELFELGIHPNFGPNSTHGLDPQAVLDHCMQLVPEATTMRSHGLLLSSQLLIDTLMLTPIRNDLTLLLSRTPALQPCEFWWHGERMIRMPTFWEDDVEFEAPQPSFDFGELISVGAGLKILTFHPLLVCLNANSAEPYRQLRARVPAVQRATERDLTDLVYEGRGVRSMFDDAVKELATRGTRTASEVSREWGRLSAA
jgi:hypothetical protein